jgi:hypothetical protein
LAINVRFRAEVFNPLNYVNYANPGTRDVFESNNNLVSTSSQITATTTPSREIQLEAKVLFQHG